MGNRARFLRSTGWLASAAVLVLALWALAFHALSDMDIVHHEFATRAEYDAHPPWLPGILPPSAYRIVTHNNLDLNTSSGEFRFAAADAAAFYGAMTPIRPDDTDEDLLYWRHAEEGYEWSFSCERDASRCAYIMKSLPSASVDPSPAPPLSAVP